MNRLLIDGYSLLYRDPALDKLRQGDFRKARESVIRRIDRLSSALAPLVELVFDGRDQGSREQSGHHRLHLSIPPPRAPPTP
jgi:predicted RNA-binding protein with PIN domain